ncbi:hypothetical protein [Virgibacillus sp.]|uniref:hypothetical protein n=1 Tax=Virgibacillus sp. TaxID=1872700 RepID=UPI0018423864|nr:hypothetical protein [Virgibacillus sp.]NWO14670.1 hypothetical protein [Virgibacillus sp.]
MKQINSDKYSLYLNAFIRTVKARLEDEHDKQLIIRNIFYGVKLINSMPKKREYDEILSAFQLASAIKGTMGKLTPKEFMNIFPIAKEFDGDKYEMKDYFYTKEYIETLDQDKPIGENVHEFLWEYMNREIMNFSVKILCLMSDLRRAEGHLGLFEEFMASQGMETPNTFKNSKGEAMYIRNGKPEKIHGTKSNHLKVVH